MRLFHCQTASLACFIVLLRGARAAPDLAFPINSQVPPVAYALQPYQFVFADSTFRSDEPPISYSLNGAPSWLSLDSGGRSLEGSPTTSDVGASTFELRASDKDGETASEVTLVVVGRPNIGLGRPILQDLEAAGPVSAPSTLLLKPLSPFAITFSSDVFSGASPSTKYYAISANSSPLPPWIQFDSAHIRFAGTSPPLRSSREEQQFYGISIIASDVPGFAEATITFQIAIAYKSLAFSPPTSTLVVVPGSDFISPPFRTNLKLDGEPLEAGQLATVSADLPSWMHLDTAAIVLSGTVPEEYRTGSVTISATDAFGNTANLFVEFESGVSGNDTSQQAVSTTAVIGEDVSFTFPTSIVGDADQITADQTAEPSWLAFSSDNFTLYGKVPEDVQPQDLALTFVSIISGNSTSILLTLHVVRKQNVSSTSRSTIAQTSSTLPFPGPTEQTRSDSPTNGGRVRPKHIIFIVLVSVLPALLVILCICFLIWWLRRRSKRKASQEDKGRESEGQRPFSSQSVQLPDTVDLPSVAESSRKASASRATPAEAPKVYLPWAPDSLPKSKERISRKLQKRKLGSFESSWSGLVARPETRRGATPGTQSAFDWQRVEASAPPPIPVYSPKRQSIATKASSTKRRDARPERRSKALSATTSRAVGLPQRRSGAGHGAGVLTVDASQKPQRSSWQTTLGSIPILESRPSTAVLEALPARSSEDKKNRGIDSMANFTKPSLRLVEASSEPSFEDQRQQWHTERARDRLEGVSRFSNAGSSRTLSFPRAMGSTAISPSRTISSTIPENGAFASPERDPSWSKWSGVGLAQAQSPMSARAPPPLFARPTPRIAREVSAASSGQFDSALSSESQWEDENLIPEINEAGERQWHTDTESAAASPRLPFEPISSSQEDVRNAKQVGMSRGARLIDKRKRVSVGETDMHRSERSQAGSFRFI